MDQVSVQKQQTTFIFPMKIGFGKQIKSLRNTETLTESPK